jgi:hypothetical protein
MHLGICCYQVWHARHRWGMRPWWWTGHRFLPSWNLMSSERRQINKPEMAMWVASALLERQCWEGEGPDTEELASPHKNLSIKCRSLEPLPGGCKLVINIHECWRLCH